MFYSSARRTRRAVKWLKRCYENMPETAMKLGLKHVSERGWLRTLESAAMNDAPVAAVDVPVPEKKRLAFFERYLTIWVLLCMVVGVAFGKLLPDLTTTLSKLEFGQGSQVNVPIGVLLWLMIYPMMLKVDFSSIGGIASRPKGLLVTLFVNWLIKPFSMAL